MSTSFIDDVYLSTLSALQQLRVMAEDGHVPMPHLGICGNIKEIAQCSGAFWETVRVSNTVTGKAYPIEGTAFNYMTNKHKWQGAYLVSRLALIDKIIKHLERAA